MTIPGLPKDPRLPGNPDIPGDRDIPDFDLPEIDTLNLFEQLRAELPLLMLPVRLETRFYRNPNFLKIRVFPDQIHVNSHHAALSESEAKLGQQFWQIAWKASWEKSARVFQQLVDTLGVWRAIWVVETTTPTNANETGTGIPSFPAPTAAHDATAPARIDLLPFRWLAVGIVGNKTRFVETGAPIPQALRFAPFDMHGDDDLDRWMVDFGAAKRVGMALEIPLTGDKSSIIDSGLDELIVVGVRPGKADDLAGLLENTLRSHYYTRGFDFVPQGTPTNNTETVRSPWQWNTADAESVLMKLTKPEPAVADSSRQRLADALGLDQDGIAARALHADTAEIPGMEAMNHALWYITWGEYLRFRLCDGEQYPIPVATLDWLRDWFIGHVRGGAVYPAFHIGSMPYGVLPVQLQPVPRDAHTKEEYLQWALSHLRDGWERSLPNVPHLDPTATASADDAPETTDLEAANDNLIALLSSHPHPTRFFSRTLNNLRTWPFWSIFFDPVKLYNGQRDAMLTLMSKIDSIWHDEVMDDLAAPFLSLDHQVNYYIDRRAEADPRIAALQQELDKIGATYGDAIPPHMVPTVKRLAANIGTYEEIQRIIDVILSLLETHAERVYPVNSLGQPPLMDVLSDETPNPEHFYFTYDDDETRDWGDLPLVQGEGAQGGASAAVYLDWLGNYARGTVSGTAPDGMSDPAPLLFQLIKASIDRANAWDNGGLVTFDNFIGDIIGVSKTESKAVRLNETQQLVQDARLLSGTADLLANALQSPPDDPTRAAIAYVPRDIFRQASAQLREYQQTSRKTSPEVSRLISVFDLWAGTAGVDRVDKLPWGGTDYLPPKSSTRLTQLASAIDVLATQAPETLELRMKETLGLAMHRLDAWITAYAEERMNDLRAATPTGIQIGGFGWVENLRPDLAGTASSQGFIHAPSMTHAAAAAVLRSGYSAYSDGSATSTLSVDLRSDRVRVARWMMDGVRQGQPVNELLGYRFERFLHDQLLDLWIDPVRDVVAAHGETEYAAARTTAVVDGLALLELWHEGAGGLESLIAKPVDDAGSAHAFSEIVPALEHLVWISDSMADLALAESVHALVQGDYERASAVQNAASFGDVPPPEVRSVQTPNSGMTITHRLLIIPQSGADGWKQQPMTIRGQFEPALDAWVGTILGSAENILYNVRGDADAAVETRSLAQLPLSALDAVYLAPPVDSSLRTSGLGKLIALDYQLRHQGEAAVTIDADIPVDAEQMSLADFVLLANYLRQVLSAARPAKESDFALGEGDAIQVASTNELMRRAVLLSNRFADAVTALEDGNAQLLNPLLQLSYFNFPQAIPESTDPERLAAQAASILPHARARRKEARGILKRLERNQTNGSGEGNMRAARAVISAVLGREYPITLRFQMPLPAEALRDQPASVNSDPHAVTGWLLKMARVRPDLASLRNLIATAEALRDRPLFPFRVVQVPTVAGEPWTGVARPNDEGADRLSLVLTGSGDLSALSGEIGGLVLDHWVERIPSDYEMTGLSFHFDAPTSRPPQSLLLAVPPVGKTWDFDLVVDTVREVFALARLRAVAPETLGEYGQHLPAVYLTYDLDITGATGGE